MNRETEPGLLLGVRMVYTDALGSGDRDKRSGHVHSPANQPSALSASQSPPYADALREAEAEPAVRVADLDEMMTLIDNA